MALMWQPISRIIFSNNPRVVLKQPKWWCEFFWTPRKSTGCSANEVLSLWAVSGLGVASEVKDTERSHLGSAHILSPGTMSARCRVAGELASTSPLSAHAQHSCRAGRWPLSTDTGFRCPGPTLQTICITHWFNKWLFCQNKDGVI